MKYYEFYHDFLEVIELVSPVWFRILKTQLREVYIDKPHGHISEWLQVVNTLPDIKLETYICNRDVIELIPKVSLELPIKEKLIAGLRSLCPWRQGPFNFFGVNVDSEWNSYFKWRRLQPYIENLSDKMILDVGCGSGYFCWRMLGLNASRVIGIDPSPLMMMQFESVKRYINFVPVHALPIRLDDLPERLHCFDMTFSMGVLYHRRDPLKHLRQLYCTLKKQGELVLETLVVEDKYGNCLIPKNGKYAGMPNVWFLPSVATLFNWLKQAGFSDLNLIDISATTISEQRKTSWMHTHSLGEFLDTNDHWKTVEGYPRPLRATVFARV